MLSEGTKKIDTYYPSYYHSSWLDFEQKHLLGWQVIPQEAIEFEEDRWHRQELHLLVCDFR